MAVICRNNPKPLVPINSSIIHTGYRPPADWTSESQDTQPAWASHLQTCLAPQEQPSHPRTHTGHSLASTESLTMLFLLQNSHVITVETTENRRKRKRRGSSSCTTFGLQVSGMFCDLRCLKCIMSIDSIIFHLVLQFLSHSPMLLTIVYYFRCFCYYVHST